jgi:hypothetical protein
VSPRSGRIARSDDWSQAGTALVARKSLAPGSRDWLKAKRRSRDRAPRPRADESGT